MEPTTREKIEHDMDEALEAFKRGEILVVMDDHRRENEGDLIVAAEKATPDALNSMVKYARGLMCVPMERSQLQKLGLSRMTMDGQGDSYNTAFMESVDASEGVTTGISAFDRAKTVESLISDASTPASIVRPGHMFPLEAAEYGVFQRGGHTEAAVDLARLAGMKPAGVICEIMREDGYMARGPELTAFAESHGLKLITIEEIANYRKMTEQLIRLEKTVPLPTPFGMFQMNLYYSIPEDEHHIALVMGEPDKEECPLVRMHSECLTGDVFGSLRCDCGAQLHEAMHKVGKRGVGVVLYMRQEGRGIGLKHKIHAYALQDEGLDTVDANTELGFDPDMRDYCAAAQMLKELGVDNLEIMTNNPEKIAGLEKYGVEVSKRTPIVIDPTAYNDFYLETKKKRLGHLL